MNYPRFMISKTFFTLLLTITFCLIAACGFTAEKHGFQRSIPDKKLIVKKAAKIDSGRYPDADTAMIHRERFIRYDRQGLYNKWDETYIKALSESGRKELKNISSTFTIPYSTTRFTTAEIIKPDGTTRPVNIEKNSRTMVERSQMSANIYNPDKRVLKLNIPEIEVGDVLHCVIHDRYDKIRTPETFSDTIFFEKFYPIVFSRTTLVAPETLPLEHIAVLNKSGKTLAYQQDKKNKQIRYQWTAENVPQAHPEPDMPPFYNVAQKVLVSTISDWEWVSRWYWNLCEPNLEKISPQMRKKVKDLTAGLESEQEKIRAIFNWVSQKIRYLGLTVEKNAPGYEPHPVSMTFENRAGVCRDKAALLASMLRIAGFRAYPALIMNGPKKNPEVPTPFFNHAVTAVKKPDGSYLLMDSTDESTVRMFPAYLNNQSYLVASPEGEKLRTSPIIAAEKNMMLVTTNATLNSSGNITGRTKLDFKGLNDNIYRGQMARMEKQERMNFLESGIREHLSSAVIKHCSIEPENMLNVSKPLQAEIAYSASDFILNSNASSIFSLPQTGRSFGVAHLLLKKTELLKRKYPLYVRYACGIRENISMTVPGEFSDSIRLPRNQSASGPGFEWERKYTLNGNEINFQNILKFKKPRYSPAEYQKLLAVLAKIEVANRQKIVAKHPSSIKDQTEWYENYSPDSVLLERSTRLDLKDQHSWTEKQTVKRKILTYAGKKDKSELKIDFNPAWEQVEVKNIQVTSPSGTTHKIDSSQKNIMDAGWAGNAPRYPAEKTLVVSFPGVEIGSVLEYTIFRNKIRQPCFSPCAILQGNEPIIFQEIIINAPRGLDLNLKFSATGFGLQRKWWREPENKAKLKTVSRGKRLEYRIVKKFAPPVPRERDIPPAFTFCPTLAGSSVTWNELGKKFDNAVQPKLKMEADSEKKFKKINAIFSKINARDQLIAAIRDFVAENINTVGPAFNKLPLSTLSSPLTTLKDGYGHSADKALVLYKLLQLNGFKPEFVLKSNLPGASELRDILHKSVNFKWFDEILVMVRNSAGEKIFLNDTNQYAHLGTTAGNKRPALFPKTGKISTISISDNYLKTALDIRYRIKLDNSGNAVVKASKTYYGMDFASLNEHFNSVSPEKKEQYIQKRISKFSRTAELRGEYKIDFDSYPGKEHFELFVKNLGVRRGDLMLIDIPGLIKKISGAGNDYRELPLLREELNRKKVNISIELPDGFGHI
ncbi:MAG: DUF3857 domain-containing protein, partial [Thermodesulfobacteriota bacterium]